MKSLGRGVGGQIGSFMMILFEYNEQNRIKPEMHCESREVIYFTLFRVYSRDTFYIEDSDVPLRDSTTGRDGNSAEQGLLSLTAARLWLDSA